MDVVVRAAADVEPEFERTWSARLARAPHANFTFLPGYLHQQAECERSHLVLVDDGAFAGALVLREAGRELVCGWPWRTQAVVAGADPLRPEGMRPDDADLLFEAARRVAGRRRLRFFAPFAPRGGASYRAGQTIMLELAHRTEERLFAGLHPDKRRWVRRAGREGLTIVDRPEVALEREFASIFNDVLVRRHGCPPVPPRGIPPSGREWRTWEMPWHEVLFALRGGRVVAGLGWGRFPCGMLDGRANAADDEGRRTGASVLLIWEALRRARAGGQTWANFGGSNRFKQDFGGLVMPLHCRLGGGVEWLAPNLIENLIQGEGRRAAHAVKAGLERSWPAIGRRRAIGPTGRTRRAEPIQSQGRAPTFLRRSARALEHAVLRGSIRARKESAP